MPAYEKNHTIQLESLAATFMFISVIAFTQIVFNKEDVWKSASHSLTLINYLFFGETQCQM